MRNDQLVGYLEAKLEALHEDIKELRAEVTELKEDFIQRRTIYKISLYVLGGLAGLVGWIMNHILNKTGLM
jgi:cell division protein FtsB